MTNKLQLFEGTTIRTIWDSQTEEWYFSVADVCNVLSGSQAKDPNAYWRKLKQWITYFLQIPLANSCLFLFQFIHVGKTHTQKPRLYFI